MSGPELIAGRFKLLRRVGSGGMGDVWAARDLSAGRQVALKVLRAERLNDAHIADRFRHEAKVGKTLNHPNITRVHEFLELDDGTLVLVMELLIGESLRTYLRKRGSISTVEAVAIILPVLAALQHAHDNNVVHRDLKPANIFLHVDFGGKMTPKLVDFGIAKSHDSSVHTQTGDALGTPSFMSPEQVRAQPLDGRSDLFAVGTVLYMAISGQNPFAAASPSAVLAQVLELDVDPDPKIDPRVWIEVSRALSKQPYQRHASAAELAKALSNAVAEGPDALARYLQRDPPPAEPTSSPEPDGLTEIDVNAALKAQGSDEAPTTAWSRRQRAQMRILMIAGAALVGLIGSLLVIASILKRESTTAKPAASIASAAPAFIAEATDSSEAADDEPLEISTASSSAVDDVPRPRPQTPARHPRPRPPASTPPRGLGRTPGF